MTLRSWNWLWCVATVGGIGSFVGCNEALGPPATVAKPVDSVALPAPDAGPVNVPAKEPAPEVVASVEPQASDAVNQALRATRPKADDAGVPSAEPAEVSVVTPVTPPATTIPAYANDAGGRLLEERLSPPRKAEIPAIPYLNAPDPLLGVILEPLPARLIPVPVAAPRKDGLVFIRGDAPDPNLPVRDLPLVAVEMLPAVPKQIRLPAGSRAYRSAPDSTAAAPLAVPEVPRKEQALASDDPTRSEAEAVLLGRRGELLQQPAAFLKLEIPDPFENRRAVQYAQPFADIDPPSPSLTRPARPNMPILPAPGPAAK